jgi:D-threonate/D-erythronate kinase
VQVLLPREGRYAPFPPRTGVVVLDTESRAATAADARTRVAAALAALRAANAVPAYKKIDSTMRGNIGAELAEILGSDAADAVLLAPSLPVAGRTVRDGIHRVRGVELALTEMARDPSWPITTSRIVELLAAQTSLASAVLTLDAVRAPAGRLASAVEGALADGVRILVGDAETDDDLRALAAAVASVPGKRVLPSGSAGLFAAVAALRGVWGAASGTSAPPGPGGVLVVSGSTSEVAAVQLGRASEAAGLPVFRPDAARLFGPAADSRREIERVSAAVRAGLAARGAAILDGASMSREELGRACEGRPGERERRAELTLDLLAAAFRTVASAVGALVLVGGDTARAICDQARVEGIEITGAVEPLVPRGVIRGGALGGAAVVTKAGALGSPRALELALAALRQGR